MSLPKPCRQHDIPEGAHYCIQCGAEVTQVATGRTERLTCPVLGFLLGEPIFEYSKEIWEDARFIAVSPVLGELWL